MDRRPLPQGDEGMTSWFGFLSFVGHDTYRQRASGFCFSGLVAAWRFQRKQRGKSVFLGGMDLGHGFMAEISFSHSAWRQGHLGELSCSSSSPTHPILMVGVWRGEREAGRLEIPFALFCSFGQAGMATYGNPFIL